MQPGDRVGKYELIRTLGKGATATVFLARDTERGVEVALKVIRLGGDNATVSRRLRKLYQTESSVGYRLNHPNIVKVFDAHIEEDCAYIAMEYVNGVSLEKFCQINNLLPMHRVVGIIFKCCLALDHAFRQGVVHRDIKPANILLDAEDNPKITDFGLALNLNKGGGDESTFVMGVGSPAYMSPEQVKDYPLNQKTDLYSLGVLFFQLLTGRLPFRASNHGALIYKIVNMDAPSVCALNPSLPAELDKVLKKALEKDLYNRYRNGAEFAKDLSAVRFQMFDENAAVLDSERFNQLRQLDFFREFEDIELWEVLRICVWRNVAEKVALIKEGHVNRFFGIVVDGFVEVSIEGRSLSRLGVGEVVGEVAMLHPSNHTRAASVVTLEPTTFLEVNAAALELSSDEVQLRFRNALLIQIIGRLRAVNKALAKMGPPAVQGYGVTSMTAPLELAPE